MRELMASVPNRAHGGDAEDAEEDPDTMVALSASAEHSDPE